MKENLRNGGEFNPVAHTNSSVLFGKSLKKLINTEKITQYNNNNIVCLPGVPDEMENILIHEVFPLLDKKLLNLHMTKTIFINGISESELAPIVNELVLKNQDVYIKSHPRGINEGVYSIEVVVSVKSTNNSNVTKF